MLKSGNLEILQEIEIIREKINSWKKENQTIGFIPTMGALHIGHESLMKIAREQCDKIITSIFVNPVQFGPNEDYNKYPRQLENDAETCLKNNVDLIFAPTTKEMYPDPENLTKICPPDFFQNKLCGQIRQGHFDGVATVVLKLFNIIQPDKAFFGQKDAQQLIIIKKMVKDLNLPVEIIGCPIIREADGLACSSRNAYLLPEARIKALSLFKTLNKIQKLYSSGIKNKDEIIITAKKCLNPEIALEYLEFNDPYTLAPLNELRPGSLVAIAAKVDGVRLIDNIIIY